MSLPAEAEELLRLTRPGQGQPYAEWDRQTRPVLADWLTDLGASALAEEVRAGQPSPGERAAVPPEGGGDVLSFRVESGNAAVFLHFAIAAGWEHPVVLRPESDFYWTGDAPRLRPGGSLHVTACGGWPGQPFYSPCYVTLLVRGIDLQCSARLQTMLPAEYAQHNLRSELAQKVEAEVRKLLGARRRGW
jgi:hypothetical protein